MAWLGVLVIGMLPLMALDLRLDGFDDRGVPRLRVAGAAESGVVVQVSRDLKGWLTVTEPLVFTNGTGVFRDLQAGRSGSTFYRAVTALPALEVKPVVDPRWSAVTVLGTNGGGTRLQLPGGVEVRLTVPPFALDSDTLIRMTAVTNLAGAPGGVGVSTVLLEPEGLELYRPATLEFIRATNALMGRVSAFASDGDGTDYHLVPLRVRSNVVEVALSHFSAWDIRSLSELEFSSAIVRHARTTRTSLERDVAVVLSGALVDGTVPEGAGEAGRLAVAAELYAEYYRRTIEPNLVAADGNCTLFKYLARQLTSVMRQRALLGAGEDEVQAVMSGAMADHFPKGIENCMMTVLEKCRAGQRSQEAVTELLALAHESEVLGVPSPQDVASIFSSCQPAAWAGTLIYEERGATNQVIYDPGYSLTKKVAGHRERAFHLKVDGRVESVTETLTPGFQVLTLKVVSTGSGSELDRTDAQFDPACEGAELTHPPGQLVLQSLDLAGTGTNRFDLSLFVQAGQTVAIPGVPPIQVPGSTNLVFEMPAVGLSGRFIDHSRAGSPDCRREGETVNVSDARSDSVSLPGYSMTQKGFVTKLTTDSIEIAGAGVGDRGGLPTAWSFRAKFNRLP